MNESNEKLEFDADPQSPAYAQLATMTPKERKQYLAERKRRLLAGGPLEPPKDESSK